MTDDDDATLEVDEPLFLPGPEEAVPVLAELLAAGDWETLARYYDLSRLDASEETGLDVQEWPEPDPSWFTDEPAPHVAIARTDPGVRFRHPFPPTFEYVDHLVEGETARIVVEGTWDPGVPEKRQEGRWAFRMRRREDGWQVLPDPVEILEEG